MCTLVVPAPYQIHITVQLHGLWDVGLPYALPQYVVRLTELNGYHDASVHGLIKVIWPVGRHDDETIMPRVWLGGGGGECERSCTAEHAITI